MVDYKHLNSNGGVILRILNPEGIQYNAISAFTGTNGSDSLLGLMNPRDPWTSGIEFKIPIEDLKEDTNKGQYCIYDLIIANNGETVYNNEAIWLSDIPNGGDGTWHYYTLTI